MFVNVRDKKNYNFCNNIRNLIIQVSHLQISTTENTDYTELFKTQIIKTLNCFYKQKSRNIVSIDYVLCFPNRKKCLSFFDVFIYIIISVSSVCSVVGNSILAKVEFLISPWGYGNFI